MSKINELKTRLSNVPDNAEIGDLVLNFFSKEFLDQDYAHLFRQERWKMGIYCPACHSNNIQKQSTNAHHLFTYICLDCNNIFEDDTGSAVAGSSIPLSVWLQLWYLNQYCNSLQYIADKLNLDLNTIINMLQGLKQLFQQDSAILKKESNLSERNNISSPNHIRQEERFKKFLILGGDSGKQPIDTAEYRRQKNIKKHNNPTKKPRV